MNLYLQRYGSIPGQGTPGTLIADDMECVTIEREWQNNAPFFSCIPSGQYTLEKHTSAKYGRTWALVNEAIGVYHYKQPESKRFACLLHSANYGHQLQGCIAPGESFGGHNGHFMVTNSRKTLEKLFGLLDTEDAHKLIIKWENLQNNH